MRTSDSSRSEFKYLISEHTAQTLCQIIRAYLALDPYMPPEQAEGYHVYSLYLDSPRLSLYRESVVGLKNRYKLRIRFYDELETSPAFLEIKSRTSECIYKLRAMVTKQSAHRLLCGLTLSPDELLTISDKSALALHQFCTNRNSLQAEGCAYVFYQREAYADPESGGVRVTLDRHLQGGPYHPDRGLALPLQSQQVAPNAIVLEFKFSGKMPKWMQDLVLAFRLKRVSFPKYVRCVDALRAGSLSRLGNTRELAC
jgi:SPX domain protein involved in polyphosphate accumulation